MFDVRMAVRENVATFRDPDDGRVVLVDSFDHRTFHVRVGTLESSVMIGDVVATTDTVLNVGLQRLLEQHDAAIAGVDLTDQSSASQPGTGEV